ncbi:MAG: TerC family protein [Phycisphaerales bacterium JB040]
MLDLALTLPDLLPLAADAAADGPRHVEFFSLAGLSALATLAALEIVLGIDNVVFIAILTQKLPEERQARVRSIGLIAAGAMRLALLALGFWIVQLTKPFATLWGVELSGKALLLLLGGLFLIAKATWEIHHLMEGPHDESAHAGELPEGAGAKAARAGATVASILTQVLLLDLVFSIDSVITAVGMTDNYAVMATAVILAVIVMIAFAGPIGRFVARHPSMKTLALAFLVLIGVLLVADGLGEHFPRGYVYFAMGFALAVELINLKAGARRTPITPEPHP